MRSRRGTGRCRRRPVSGGHAAEDGRRRAPRAGGRGALLAGALVGTLAAGYMLFESQWLRCSERSLPVRGLPAPLEGVTILHLSDVHAGQPGLNLHTFEKAVDWAGTVRPDLIVLTGDILGSRWGWGRSLSLLQRLRAPLGVFAVPGNHEYGLSKNPLAHLPSRIPWESCGVTELRDTCVALDLTAIGRPGEGAGARRVTLCGADYLSGGASLVHDEMLREAGFTILLVHRPPEPGDPLSAMFDLTFSGHTHGGQIRIPTPWGLRSLHNDYLPYLEGVYPWGDGRLLVVSPGIGTTFLPLRLLTRPQAVMHRLTAVADEHIDPFAPSAHGSDVDTKVVPSGIYKEHGSVGVARDGGGGRNAKG